MTGAHLFSFFSLLAHPLGRKATCLARSLVHSLTRSLRMKSRPFQQRHLSMDRSIYSNWTKEQLIDQLLTHESAKTVQCKRFKTSSLPLIGHSNRMVAFKVAYLGFDYHGLARQESEKHTIEASASHMYYTWRMVQTGLFSFPFLFFLFLASSSHAFAPSLFHSTTCYKHWNAVVWSQRTLSATLFPMTLHVNVDLVDAAVQIKVSVLLDRSLAVLCARISHNKAQRQRQRHQHPQTVLLEKNLATRPCSMHIFRPTFAF